MSIFGDMLTTADKEVLLAGFAMQAFMTMNEAERKIIVERTGATCVREAIAYAAVSYAKAVVDKFARFNNLTSHGYHPFPEKDGQK